MFSLHFWIENILRDAHTSVFSQLSILKKSSFMHRLVLSGASNAAMNIRFVAPAVVALKLCLIAFSVVGLSACSSQFEPFFDSAGLPDSGVMSGGASLTNLIVQDPKRLKRICMGRGTDAVIQQSDSANFDLSLISVGKKTDSEKSAIQDNAGEQEMAGRTPAVLLAREIFYRGCEFSNNFNLNKDEALGVFKASLDAIEKIWLIEAQNTKTTVGDSLDVKESDIVSTTRTNTGTADTGTADTGTNKSSTGGD